MPYTSQLFVIAYICFTGIFCNLYIYVKQRGVKSQNKMDFQGDSVVCVNYH